MKKNPIIVSIIAFMILLISYELNAELRSYTPNKLTYTGYLCDDSGNPINNSVNLTFDIYDVSSGGTSLWNSPPSNVDINNGFFSVILDNITIFGEEYTTLYLQVKVNNETLLPRQEITAVPSSISTTNWDGGTVINEATFNSDVYLEGNECNVRWDNVNSRLMWEDQNGDRFLKLWKDKLRIYDGSNNKLIEIDGSAAAEINISSAVTNNEIRMMANNVGDCRLTMDSQSYNFAVYLTAEESDGGGGRLKLEGPYGTWEIDTNEPFGLRARNSSGDITFEVDTETGNIHYSGELIKK
jgi:hypothetical protein